MNNIKTCEICGFTYVKGEDSSKHHKIHMKYLKACGKYGKILHYKEREALKQEAYEILRDESACPRLQMEAAKKLAYAYFCRSVEGHEHTLRHPVFGEYVAMLNMTNSWTSIFTTQVVTMLISKYGRSPGITDGMTTWNG